MTQAASQPATQTNATTGDQFRSTPAVRNAIDSIVTELRGRQSQIKSVRPARPELIASYDEAIKRSAAARGRPLLYPYIGSGMGNGVFVELADGSVKYDLTNGIGPHFFGHSDADLVRTALEAATGDVAMQGHFQANEDALLFTETIVREASRRSRLKHAFLTNSGAMANDNALKLCYQKHAPASRVIAFRDCFMGRSVTMCQIGDAAAGRVGVPLQVQVDYIPFYDEAAVSRMGGGDVSGRTKWIDMCVWHLNDYVHRYPKQHAAFVFELVQGEGGYNTAPREFFKALMDACKAAGIPVWIDEIQTFGRTQEMFAFEALDLGEYVDVCTIGKMSQVCAALYTEEYNPQPGLLSGTFLGSSVGLRVGRRIIERLREGDYYGDKGVIARHHKAFRTEAEALAKKHPEWFPQAANVVGVCGGAGGMMRLTPFGGRKEPVLKTCRAMFDEGVIALYCGHGPHHIRLLPPLGNMDLAEWPEVFTLIETALAKVAPGVA